MAQPRRRQSRSVQPFSAGVRRGLVERRIDLGLTQEELADLAGVSRAALQRLEAGVASTRLETLGRVAEALGCRVALVDATGALVEGSDES